MSRNIEVQKAFHGFWSSVRVVKFDRKANPATVSKIRKLWLGAVS